MTKNTQKNQHILLNMCSNYVEIWVLCFQSPKSPTLLLIQLQ